MGYKLVSNNRKIYILKSKFAASMQNKREPKKQSHNTNKYSLLKKKKTKQITSYIEQITSYTLICGPMAPHILPHLKIWHLNS